MPIIKKVLDLSGGNGLADGGQIITVETGEITANTLLTVDYGSTIASSNPVLYVHDGTNIVGCSILRPKSGTETTQCEIKLPYGVAAPGLDLTIVG